jgi:hypothetical protein
VDKENLDTEPLRWYIVLMDAQEMGRKGGKARWAKLSKAERSKIAKKASKAAAKARTEAAQARRKAAKSQ